MTRSRIPALLLMAAMAAQMAACAAENPADLTGGETQAIWPVDSEATYSADLPDDNNAASFSDPIFQVGKKEGGKDTFAAVHFTLSADFLSGEEREARLFLRPVGEAAPQQLIVAPLTGAWDSYMNSRKDVAALVDAASAITSDAREENGGFASFAVTEIAAAWLSGDLENNGIAIFAAAEGESFSFASMYGEIDTPYIAVAGKAGDRPLAYGKFGYTKTPLPGALDMGGNCMSYALRDTYMILGSDMGLVPGELASAYRSGGVDALCDYTALHVLSYVEANKDSLAISKFRQIDSYDSEIDPKTEYRIAMRLGADPYREPDFSQERSFDYHFWVQLNDGRWAQKYPTGDSMIIPCTAHDMDPGKYLWSAGYGWTEKNRGYYTSKIAYFAVTKDTGEITRHREGPDNRE